MKRPLESATYLSDGASLSGGINIHYTDKISAIQALVHVTKSFDFFIFLIASITFEIKVGSSYQAEPSKI